MCGIIGITQRTQGFIGKKLGSVVGEILKRLEYRGYDSVGFAIISDRGEILISKAKGKLDELYTRLGFDYHDGVTAIGHTRWATHGAVSDINAHPHTDCSRCIAVVHNGIIQNYDIIRRELESEGHVIVSETDTELIAHLIEKYLKESNNEMLTALKKVVKRISGTYAILVMYCREPQKIYFAKYISPLIIGLGNGYNIIASDIPALVGYSEKYIVLEDGELGYVTPGEIYIEKYSGERIDLGKRILSIEWSLRDIDKGGYHHFMLKEIYEQPYALEQTLAGAEDQVSPEILDLFEKSERIFITGAGSSYHAGLVMDYALKRYMGLPVISFISSEVELYKSVFREEDLLIAISQSGETIDTLRAVKIAKSRGAATLAISNVVNSAIAREADLRIYTRAGPEIGVAATKTFTTQVALLLYVVYKLLGRKDPLKSEKLINELRSIPRIMTNTLDQINNEALRLAEKIYNKNSFYVLGRDISYPVSLEGALKIKEISYIHAEAYPAGESKHGPIALVNNGFPVFFTVFDREGIEDLVLGNIEEMRSRGAFIITIAPENLERVHTRSDYLFKMPRLTEINSSILYIVPYQLIAYHLAIKRGYDPDKPRNLAKTVTVD